MARGEARGDGKWCEVKETEKAAFAIGLRCVEVVQKIDGVVLFGVWVVTRWRCYGQGYRVRGAWRVRACGRLGWAAFCGAIRACVG